MMFYSYKNGNLFVFSDKKTAIYTEENVITAEKLIILFNVYNEDILVPYKCNYMRKDMIITDSYTEYIKMKGRFNMDNPAYPCRNLLRDYFGQEVCVL